VACRFQANLRSHICNKQILSLERNCQFVTRNSHKTFLQILGIRVEPHWRN